MAHNDNVTRLFDQPKDYVDVPIMWTDEHWAVDLIPEPMFTFDEMIVACFLSCFVGMLVTVALAFAWSFIL